jgi:hypothetical protein
LGVQVVFMSMISMAAISALSLLAVPRTVSAPFVTVTVKGPLSSSA